MTRSILRNSILLAVLLYAFTTFLSAQKLTTLYSFAGSDGARPLCRVSARQRRQLLRDNHHWRGKQRGHGLQNHARRHPDHPPQLRRR